MEERLEQSAEGGCATLPAGGQQSAAGGETADASADGGAYSAPEPPEAQGAQPEDGGIPPEPEITETWDDEDGWDEPRRRPWWATLLLWLGMVALIVGVIVAGVVFSMYRAVTPGQLPERAVSFDGQALQPQQYLWRVPVAGPLQKQFELAGGEPQQLQPVRTSAPALSVPQGLETALTVQAGGSTVFEGDAEAFGRFQFGQDGEYTARLVVSQPPPDFGSGITGSDTYEFSFRLSAEPQLQLSAEKVAQGSVLALRVTGVLGDLAPSLTTDLGEAVFFKHNGAWLAYLGVPHDCIGGDYVLRVSAGDYRLEATVRVYGREIRELDTYTADGTAAIPFIGAVPAGIAATLDICDPAAYWMSKGFIQPVQGSLARDYDVREYTDRIDDATLALYPELQAVNDAIRPRRSCNVTFALPPGTQVVSPGDGRVVFAGVINGGGRTLVIEHGSGLKSIFYLLGSLRVSEGDYVLQGDPVATSQGHIICDVRLGDAAIDPWALWRNSSPALKMQ